ncbi:NFX1-type zinc finger-containing protein 1 [Symbiodinium microadriaticum]|uniref:NFX1-type zinc finger-containing protein 1 n=1 Tax=Symbiodinium microadriaticum TaxID=2951 RepID=A0A1Q9DER1_SYMMI|nr:NFX1-type zinc finger-containing protein 1 [Symbiodinium microadriaticum]
MAATVVQAGSAAVLASQSRVGLRYPEIRGVAARCFFMSHFHLEDDEGESHSKQNTFEANFVSALCAHLVTSGYEESQITVLSPYLGQVRLLKRKIQRDPSTQGIAVTAVDNFQGEENDVIVISLVRSNRARQMGFLAVDNRINVALTRARHGLFIVGNTDMLEKHTLWSQILRELKSDECLAETLPIVDKEQKGPFEVKSADEISVFLENKVHQSGGEGMITIDEYRKSQEVRRKKGQSHSRGDQPDRWLEHKVPQSLRQKASATSDVWVRLDEEPAPSGEMVPAATTAMKATKAKTAIYGDEGHEGQDGDEGHEGQDGDEEHEGHEGYKGQDSDEEHGMALLALRVPLHDWVQFRMLAELCVEPVLPEVSDPQSAVLQFAGKCTTMKSMKATKATKTKKAMKRPAAKVDDCGAGGAENEAPAWAVAPFYEGGTFANCAQLEGRCWVMSEAIPLSITVGELLETMTSPGCGKGFWYEPIGLAMAVRAHRSQGDDKGSDDDKKKDDDSPKDDGKKKDDDPERAGGVVASYNISDGPDIDDSGELGCICRDLEQCPSASFRDIGHDLNIVLHRHIIVFGAHGSRGRWFIGSGAVLITDLYCTAGTTIGAWLGRDPGVTSFEMLMLRLWCPLLWMLTMTGWQHLRRRASLVANLANAVASGTVREQDLRLGAAVAAGGLRGDAVVEALASTFLLEFQQLCSNKRRKTTSKHVKEAHILEAVPDSCCSHRTDELLRATCRQLLRLEGDDRPMLIMDETVWSASWSQISKDGETAIVGGIWHEDDGQDFSYVRATDPNNVAEVRNMPRHFLATTTRHFVMKRVDSSRYVFDICCVPAPSPTALQMLHLAGGMMDACTASSHVPPVGISHDCGTRNMEVSRALIGLIEEAELRNHPFWSTCERTLFSGPYMWPFGGLQWTQPSTGKTRKTFQLAGSCGGWHVQKR